MKKKQIKWQKLGGNRWRLECGEGKVVIVKNEDGTASLESMGGRPFGLFEDWAKAKVAAGYILE